MSETTSSTVALLRTRAGRLVLKRRAGDRLWPAAARLARVYRRTLARRPRIVAVIGSAGKTTTMRAVSAGLGRPVSRRALLNMNSHAAVGRTLLGIRPWQRHVVLEVGINGPGQMGIQAATVRPQVVVVTSIGRDHWRSLGTIERTRDEKAEMVRALPAGSTAILNADDPNVRWMASQTATRVILAGEAADAEVRATDVELDWPHGMRLLAHIGDATWPVRTRLLGRQMVFPVLAALAVADLEGVPLPVAIAALADLAPTPGRMQTTVLANGAVVVRDEFKGTLESWHAALEAFAAVPARRHFVLLGEIAEVGGRDDYRSVASRAASFAHRAIIVGAGTTAQLYRSGAAAGGLARDRIDHVRTAAEATELLRAELRDGDALLIRGRWQQGLGRVGLALAGRDVRCQAEPCPFKRMVCDVCPFLEQPFRGVSADAVAG